MKRIILLFTIMPIIAYAQSKISSSSKLPLIESITSDTVNGKFNQVVFSYDEYYRVVGITKKEISISTGSNILDRRFEQIIETQNFEYKGNATDPFSRKLVSFEFDGKSKKWNKTTNEQKYILYENGKRVRDSTLYFDPETKVLKLINISKLDQDNTRIALRKDLSIPNNESSSGDNIFMDNLYLNDSSLNIETETSQHFYDRAGRDRTSYEFSKYDQMVNPLNQLNIANSLCIEKISLSADGSYGEKAFSFYFVNKNNVLNLMSSTEDFNSALDDTYNIMYSYNKFKQPIYAKARIKQEIRRMRMTYKTYQKSFTFRYK